MQEPYFDYSFEDSVKRGRAENVSPKLMQIQSPKAAVTTYGAVNQINQLSPKSSQIGNSINAG